MQLCCIQNRTVGTWGALVPTPLNFNIIEKRTNRNKQFIIIVFLQIYGLSVVPAMFPMDILSFVCFIILHTKTEEVILMSTTKSSTMGWNTFLKENSYFYATAFSLEIRVKHFFEGTFLILCTCVFTIYLLWKFSPSELISTHCGI